MKYLALPLLGLFSTALFASPVNVRVDAAHSVYFLHKDKTYTSVFAEKDTLLTERGVQQGQRATQTFFPDTQKLKLIDAYVIQPDGRKVPVTKKNFFIRPSAASRNAPGFTNSLTATVVFPQLTPGCQTVVKWAFAQIKPSLMGINIGDTPDFLAQVKRQQVTLYIPNGLKLHWANRGYHVAIKQKGNERILTATVTNKPQQEIEARMVSPLDFNPYFIASSMPSWAAVGDRYWEKAKDRIIISPKIRALAKKIVGKKTGHAAAQALYDWVATNIHYVAVFLAEAAGYVPHKSTTILQNGYGDCKDHVTLLAALLEAVNIKSEPVIVGWGRRYQTFPIPTINQFNHLMIYLPKYKIFANPTDQFASFGVLDRGLYGKFVVIASDHSRGVYLPKTKPSENQYHLNNNIQILDDGTVVGKNHLTFHGSFNNPIRRITSVLFTSKRLANQLLATTPEGGTGNIKLITDPNNLTQDVKIEGNWKSPFAVNMNHEIFMTTPIGIDLISPHQLRNYISTEHRKYPIVSRAEILHWHYVIHVPAGYAETRLPKNVTFKNSAGKYVSRYMKKNNTIVVHRKLTINKTLYSTKEYPEFSALIYKPINDARSVIELSDMRWLLKLKLGAR